MTTDLATTTNTVDLQTISSIVTKGDLSKLTESQRVQHYMTVCNALGLTASTTPLAYLTLKGKLILYATRAATEQLCAKHGLSVEITARETVGDIYMVYSRCWQNRGKSDERFADSEGAVPINGLRGEDLSNAYLKASTKARRRSVLSLMGLSLLDETEVETIPGAVVHKPPPTQDGVFDAVGVDDAFDHVLANLYKATTASECAAVIKSYIAEHNPKDATKDALRKAYISHISTLKLHTTHTGDHHALHNPAPTPPLVCPILHTRR
jgi:hypothetical protein